MDDKGRVSLPIRFREQLGDLIAIGRGSDGQVKVLPMPLYNEMLEQAKRAAAEGIRDESLDLFWLMGPIEIDRQGRIIVSAALRRHAHLSSDVTIAGRGPHIEIWDRDLWQARWDAAVAKKRLADETAQRSEQPDGLLFKGL